jgi:TetR/AcrR family transcriptional regulator, transcriptional repressor for nem operon
MARTRQPGNADTAARILDSAERLVQSRGFNGFSYADVAAELGVTKASLHYHFPGKAELGEALIGRYAARFSEALEEIDAGGGDAPARLAAYARIYGDVLRDKRMCLCGMLAADYDTLPEPMRDAVLHFFDANEGWLTNVLEQGQAEGSIHLDGSAGDAAQALVGGLEGALLIARPYGEVARFEAAATQLLTSLAGRRPSQTRVSTARVTAPGAKRSRGRRTGR